MKKVRLDQVLVERALYPSREQAQRAVMAGEVRIGEQVAQKPSLLVDPKVCITDGQLERAVSALTEAICHSARQPEGCASVRPGLAAASPSEVAKS